MRRARLAAAAAVMVLAAVATAGCGSGDDGGGGGETEAAAPVGPHASALVKELNRVRSTDASRAWTSYGDLAAQRALGGGKIPAQLMGMSGYGWPTTQQRDASAKKQLGLDGSKADRAVEVGETHGSGRFDGGIDTATVVAGAKGLGAHKDGTVGDLTLWRLGDDNQDHLPRAVVELSRGTADFNVLAAGDDALVRAPSKADAELLATEGGKDTLARDLRFRAVADCLGRPLAATFTDQRLAMGAASPRPVDFTTGAGVSGTSPDELTQVACRTTSSKDEAEKVADALRDELAHGKTRLSRLPWHGMLSDAEVTVVDGPGHVVRITGTSRKSPQLVLEMLRSGDLSDLLDTDN